MLKRALFIVGVVLVLLSIAGFVFVSTRFPRQTSVASVSGQGLVVPPVFVPTRSNYPFTADALARVSPRGCSWSGLMGSVVDLKGKPLVGYRIRVRGDEKIEYEVESGSSEFKSLPEYDESAWDVPLKVDGTTTGVWLVQLYQAEGETPVSDAYRVRLEAVCGTNAVFIRFVQNH